MTLEQMSMSIVIPQTNHKKFPINKLPFLIIMRKTLMIRNLAQLILCAISKCVVS